jgi:hypothetical protein
MLFDLAHDTLNIIKYSLVRKPENSQALADHVSIACLIVMPSLIQLVNSAITFHDKVCLAAEEVGNVVSKLMLATKLKAQELPIAKASPQQFFSRCLGFSQFARELCLPRYSVFAAILTLLLH